MITKSITKHKTYFDSVKLMDISSKLKRHAGITQALAIMGTERNKAALEASGLMDDTLSSARPDDLVVVVQGESAEAVERAMSEAQAMLIAGPSSHQDERESRPRSLSSAMRLAPDANLALISVPGAYATTEAMKALEAGLNVMIFSDNVGLDEEIRLKAMGRRLGLIVMGPDCGTAIISGTPLGFANSVGPGPVGIVGASGTGTQQVAVLIDRLGSGITHVIGTGGRDLKDEVGGISMLMGMDALAEDDATRVIVLISKPPGRKTADRILEKASAIGKPVVVCFLGSGTLSSLPDGVFSSPTLEDAALRAVALAEGKIDDSALAVEGFDELCKRESARLKPGSFLRGLFTGGSLADEAMLIINPILGDVFSNIPLAPELRLEDAQVSREHTVIDLGDDEFTFGRPHPMIDPSLRSARILAEADDPEMGIILCDLVLGYGAHPNPAAELRDAVIRARAKTKADFVAIASVCGTESDPQKLSSQESILAEAGILVFPSNAMAAKAAATIASLANGGGNHGR